MPSTLQSRDLFKSRVLNRVHLNQLEVYKDNNKAIYQKVNNTCHEVDSREKHEIKKEKKKGAQYG